MPRGLKRYYGQGQLHFVAFSCYRRLALLGNSAGKEYVRPGALQSSARVWIPAGGLCGDAQPCAIVDERAEKGHAVDGDADAQATGFTKDEEEGACELEGQLSLRFPSLWRSCHSSGSR